MAYFSCIIPGIQVSIVVLMKALIAFFGLVLPLLIINAPAQVAVDLKLDQDQFLPGETMPLSVHITNRSGQTIHLGNDGWLTFYIQADNGSVVNKKMDPPVKDPFDLNNG